MKSYYDFITFKAVFSSYADLDIPACNLQAIIKERQEDLVNYGILLAEENRPHDDGYVPRFENGFYILSHHLIFLRCLNKVLIQPSIIRLRLLAHLEGNDEKLKDVLVIQEIQAMLGIRNLKDSFDKSILADREFVYARLEPVLLALHNRMHGLSYIVQIGRQQFHLDFTSEIAKPREFSFDSLLCNPAGEYGTTGKIIDGHVALSTAPKIFEEGHVYVPTVAIQFPPSKFLQK